MLLVIGEKELIGEGVGFGVPVIKYEDKTYFSRSAKISLKNNSECTMIIKKFEIDSISKKRLGEGAFLNDGFYNFFHRYFERAYLNWKNFRHVFNKLIELRKLFRINTQFVKGEYKGRIDVYYKIFSHLIEIEINFKELSRKGIKEILILNELSATVFSKYFDTDGCQLFDSQIEAWEQVKAKKASFSDYNKSIIFSVQRINGAKLIRGREHIKKRFAWAGFTYSLDANINKFNYTIFLDGKLI